MELTASLSDDRRSCVETRLRTNLMAWLTTVNAAGRPDSVPVWFLLCDDGRILVYSQPGKAKLRNITGNAHVALGLDVTDIGRDIIRIEGTAVHDPNHQRADRLADYAAKYTERIGAIFGTVARSRTSLRERVEAGAEHVAADGQDRLPPWWWSSHACQRGASRAAAALPASP